MVIIIFGNMKKIESKSEQVRKRVAQFYDKWAHLGKSFTVSHFADEGFHKDTIYKIIRRYLERGTVATKPGSGRPARILTPRVIQQLAKQMNSSDDFSFSKAAAQYGCHKTHISRTLKEKCVIKNYKGKRYYASVKTQCSRSKRRCGQTR